MFAQFYSSDWLTPERLDTDFYDPDAIVALNKIYNFDEYESFGSSGEVWGFGAYELCNSIVESNCVSDPGFIKIKDISAPFIDESSVLKVTSKTHTLLNTAHVKAGDIVVSIAGTIGSSAIIPESKVKYSANQALVKYRTNEEVFDNYYVLAFTLSEHFKVIARKEAGGAVQKNLYLFNFERMPIPKPCCTAQTYIGDKVRQAERLRALAKQLVADVDRRLNSLQLPINKMPEKSTFSSPSLLSDRLDPRPYRSNVVELVEKIKSIDHERLSSIVNATSGCPVKSSDFIEGEFEVPLVRIRNIGTKDFIGLDTGVNRGVYADSANYQAKEGMIVIGMDGYFRAQYFLPEELPMLINQRVAMLSPTAIRSELLVHWLNRPEGQLQLNQWAVKTTVEHTSLSDISKVLIPRLDENTEEHFADNLSYARYAERLSKRCTSLAKLLVESLIEGHISEQELIDAQQALESGNKDLDRALLARFSAKGIDVDGASPLFDDLDQLYSLLEQAELALQEA
ncbi:MULTISPECIES: restriction endonuclease subunit S [unclassified Vibrio]|uniref:restriction endonuclease subunit S n=1 Tax=unclassified Vibrio TaxID=2614977 RepID=UPI00159EA41C|nr:MULTISPECIES: restriction endonuclease subunit S [unclassified Vibrio]NVN80288.1 restriction endonuclease subunit S [Vibrio sp. Scap16]QLE95893.1 restriction endonuclease subunit S [Vibrio sp. Scap24]